MCPKTTTTQIQDDKFRNMWLSQDIIPACHIANDKYIYNFVLAHNNTIMAYKDALAKVFFLKYKKIIIFFLGSKLFSQ